MPYARYEPTDCAGCGCLKSVDLVRREDSQGSIFWVSQCWACGREASISAPLDAA
jgi:hypothetical protein